MIYYICDILNKKMLDHKKILFTKYENEIYEKLDLIMSYTKKDDIIKILDIKKYYLNIYHKDFDKKNIVEQISLDANNIVKKIKSYLVFNKFPLTTKHLLDMIRLSFSISICNNSYVYLHEIANMFKKKHLKELFIALMDIKLIKNNELLFEFNTAINFHIETIDKHILREFIFSMVKYTLNEKIIV